MDLKQAANEFFNNLPTESETEKDFKIFEEPKVETKQETAEPTPATQEASEETSEETSGISERPQRKPTRAERRFEEHRQQMEEELARARERIAVLEHDRTQSGKSEEVDPNIKRLLYEVKDPEEGTKVLNDILKNMSAKMREEFRAELETMRASEEGEVDQLYGEIERNIESIEDRYGVDLTDDVDTRNAFLDFVESIAPANSDELPNMEAAWRYFQSTRKAGPSNVARKQEIASRSMTRSVNSKPKPENVKPVSFDEINRGGWWDKIVGNK